jgi:hypothetical protein
MDKSFKNSFILHIICILIYHSLFEIYIDKNLIKKIKYKNYFHCGAKEHFYKY